MSLPHRNNIYKKGIIYKGRYKMREVNLDDFFCPNSDCPDYGKRGGGNVKLKEYYDKNRTALTNCI